MIEVTLKVNGMTCTGCEARIKRVLSQMVGVEKVSADYTKKTVSLVLEDISFVEDIKEKLEELDYKVEDK